MKRKVLGKGIAAIISNESVAENRITDIEIDQIYPSPFQPRRSFDIEKIQDLADSMRESGLIQPIVVYKSDGKYFLIVGERRWRAAQLLKWEKVPAVIRDVSEKDGMIESLIENIQREDLNAVEMAEGIESLIRETGYNHQEVGDKLGMNRTTVTNLLRLLHLPEKVKDLIISGKIDQGHARALLSLKNEDQMIRLAGIVIKKKLSARQTEALVKNFALKKKRVSKDGDPDILRIENKLTRALSTKVKVSFSGSGKGKLEIYFNQLEDFDRIYNLLLKE